MRGRRENRKKKRERSGGEDTYDIFLDDLTRGEVMCKSKSTINCEYDYDYHDYYYDYRAGV